MIGSDIVRRARGVDPDRRDLALGTCVAGAAVAEVAIRGAADAVTLITVVVAGLALALRRRRPEVMAGLLVGALLVRSAADGGQDSDVAAFAAVIAAFSVGELLERRRSLRLLAVLVAGYAADQIVLGVSPALAVFAGAAVAGIPWFGGRLLASHGEMTAELQRRTDLLEEARAQSAELAAQAERTRLARDVQAVVTRAIADMADQADCALASGPPDADRMGAAFTAIESHGRAALAEMRAMLGTLRAEDRPTLAPQPSIAELDALVDQARQAGWTVDLTIAGAPRRLPLGVDVSAYRIVQEVLGAEGTTADADAHVDLTVTYDSGELRLDLATSRPPGGLTGGRRWVAIRERVALYGGALTTRPNAGGQLLTARLPLTAGEVEAADA